MLTATRVLARLMACSACLLVAGAAPPQDPLKEDPPSAFEQLFRLPPVQCGRRLSWPGCRRGVSREVVTARRAYALALIRARSGPKEPGAAPAESLDPKALEAEAARLGSATSPDSARISSARAAGSGVPRPLRRPVRPASIGSRCSKTPCSNLAALENLMGLAQATRQRARPRA